jgi:hypothetical protein
VDLRLRAGEEVVKRAVLALLAAAALAGAYLLLMSRRPPAESPRLRELRAGHAALQKRFASHLAAEPLVGSEEVDAGDVVIATRTRYLGDVIREVASRYLDRVTLDLSPHIRVRESGVLKAKTFFGTLKLGQWDVDLTIARIRGTLGGGRPTLSVSRENRVNVVMPVSVISGEGSGRIRFTWDSQSMTEMVCKDFREDEALRAVVMPDEHELRGAFVLSAEKGSVVARPDFVREKHRVRLDLVPESWARVRAALQAQDTLGRCGLAINPDDILPKLRALAAKGFEFKLPRSLFRPVSLPAHFYSQLEMQGARAEVEVEPRLLRLTEENLWYAAALRARLLTRLPPLAKSPAPRGRP